MHAVQIALMRSELDEFHWHAQTATGAVDLTSAGLQPKLSHLASCLLDQKRYAAFLAAAPQVTRRCSHGDEYQRHDAQRRRLDVAVRGGA